MSGKSQGVLRFVRGVLLRSRRKQAPAIRGSCFFGALIELHCDRLRLGSSTESTIHGDYVSVTPMVLIKVPNILESVAPQHIEYTFEL